MAFEELKERHAAMWGAGPFERIAPSLADMHQALIDAVAARPGDRWLDVGCGTGELAFLAAGTGATIRGADLSPTLVETARRQARERGHEIEFEVADCEGLPYDDGSYDVVTSSVGVIFAPDHGRVAAELGRVVRPEGRFALTAWTQDGNIGEFFRIIGSYAPPPVPGAGSSLSWGDPDYCEAMLGEAFDLEFSEHDTPWVAGSAEEMWAEMSEAFGPIVTLLRTLDAERAAAFQEEMLGVFGKLETDEGTVLERPYLLVRGTRLPS